MTFVRTVLGDVEPADLGPTYAHEHIQIGPGGIVDQHPDMLLDDPEQAIAELEPARSLGLAAVVDALPSGGGRRIGALAEISRRSGIHVVASTGLHLARYYAADHWSATAPAEAIAGHFCADVREGIDERDDLGPDTARTPHRAGVVKVAGGAPRLSDRDRRVFEAATATHRETGAPILTHCSDGLAALEQLEILAGHGVDPGHVILSHTDKVVERGYHRDILSTGAFVEYDQAFRWRVGQDNGTLRLLGWMLEDGFGDRLMLGLDAARQGYWTTYGGSPGMTFLLGAFAAAMRGHGIDDEAQRAIFVGNPARAFRFAAQQRV